MKEVWIATLFAAVLIFGILTFSAVNAQEKYSIPSWVKGVAGFWAEDKISDDDFGEGLAFLIDEDIIKVPKIESLKQQVAQLESKVNQLEQENIQLKSQPKSSTSNLDIIVKQKSSVGMSEYCQALMDWNEQYQGVEWLTAETKKEFNKLCISTTSPSTITSETKIINVDKTLGSGWDTTLGKLLPRPSDLVGTWQLGEKKSYIADPREQYWGANMGSSYEGNEFTSIEYNYYTIKNSIFVDMYDYDVKPADEYLEEQKSFNLKVGGGREISSDGLNGECFTYHVESSKHYVFVYCIKQPNIGFEVEGVGSDFNSNKKYVFQIANIILDK